MVGLEEKVPGGKLVKIAVDQGKVLLTGDFFIYPEEGTALIEQVLSSLGGQESQESVEAMLNRLTAEHHIELIGLDEHVIARLYVGALHVAGPGA